MRNPTRRTCVLAVIVGSSWMAWAGAQEAAAPADLPSADSILDRYIEVTGGKDAYESLTSTTAKGTMEIAAAGLTGTIEVYVEPGSMYTRIELPNVGVIETGVTKDGVAWENSVITGPRIMTGAQADIAVAGAHPAAQLHWREQYPQVATTGVEDVGGEAAYAVVLTTEGGFSITQSYGIESGLLLKQRMMMATPGVGELQIQSFFEDYQEFGGILSASKVVIDQGVAQSLLTFTSGETNVDIPDERFEMPEAVQALVQ